MTEHFNDRHQTLSATDTSPNQIYTTLHSDEIRTLLLAPSTQPNACIICEIEVTKTTTTHQYEALSYVWGPTPSQNAIQCNGVTFHITTSLHQALSRLRYPTAWRRLWVDQLCIDQKDVEEVMAQVRRMGDIYSDACRVVVWLGGMDGGLGDGWRVIEETGVGGGLVGTDFLDGKVGRTTGLMVEQDVESKEGRTKKRDKVRGMERGKAVAYTTPLKRLGLSKGWSKSSPKPLTASHTPVEFSPLRDLASSSSRSRFRNQSSASLRSSSSFSSSSSRSLRSSLSSSTESLGSLSSSTSSLRSFGSFNSFITPTKPSRKIRWSSTSLVSSSPSSSISTSTSTSTSNSALTAALAIFQHPYFTRKWTFQEIVMAKAAIVMCGDSEMSWSDLSAWYFHYIAKGRRKGGLVYDCLGAFEGIIGVRCEIQKANDSDDWMMDDDTFTTQYGRASNTPNIKSETEITHDTKTKLSKLLILTRHRSSLKAEDTIYALLGLHKPFSTYLKKITDEEGWLPLPELFLSAFRYCIEVERDLTVLSAAGLYNNGNDGKYSGWPSWLPDWRVLLPLRPLVLDKEGQRTGSYNASGPSKVQCRILEDEDQGRFLLRIHGVRIGVAVTRTASWPNLFFVAGEMAQEVLDEKTIPSTLSQRISAFSSSFGQTSSRNGDQRHSDGCDTNGDNDYATQTFNSALKRQESCEPLRCSASVRTGDWICLFLGAPVLYVLRPVHSAGCGGMGDPASSATSATSSSVSSTAASLAYPHETDGTVQCRFVGECAVNGLMDGSLMEDIDGGSVVEFELV